MTSRGFSGAVAEHYAQYRRGYPPAVVDRLVAELGLDHRSRVLDLGCGTGQLTVPLAERTGAVVGVDIEPDMLHLARRTSGPTNITWMPGADIDVASLLDGSEPLDGVVIAQALHWMDAPRLFSALRSLVRPGGGIAVVTNGTPLWFGDTAWSRWVRDHLESWFGTTLTARCGTDEAARREYRRDLVTAGFDTISERAVTYTDDLTFAQLVGGLYSSMSPEQLPGGADRATFEAGLRAKLGAEVLTEEITVTMLVGRTTLAVQQEFGPVGAE